MAVVRPSQYPIIIGSIAFVVILCAVYVWWQARRSHAAIRRISVDAGLIPDMSRVVLWRGRVSFGGSDLLNAKAFPDLHPKRLSWPRRALFALYKGRASAEDADQAGGRLTVQTDGVHWSGGSWLAPFGGISGSFVLSWTDIKSIDIVDIAGKLNALGGDLTIELSHHRVTLSGEFLGSRIALHDAIAAAQSRSRSSREAA